MKSKIFHLKRQAISQNFVLGIDPGKEKHSGSVFDAMNRFSCLCRPRFPIAICSSSLLSLNLIYHRTKPQGKTTVILA